MIKRPDILVLFEKLDDLQHKKYPDRSSWYGQFKREVRHVLGTYIHTRQPIKKGFDIQPE
jgi:hypothetical protein